MSGLPSPSAASTEANCSCAASIPASCNSNPPSDHTIPRTIKPATARRAQFLRLSNPMDDARVTADTIRDTTNSHSRCSNRKVAPGGMSEGSGPVSMSIPAEGKTTKDQDGLQQRDQRGERRGHDQDPRHDGDEGGTFGWL